MDLKFFLNKFAKIDNIENYYFRTILEMKKTYENYLDASEGSDPDFPLMNFGGKGTKISKGTNIYQLFGDEEDIPDDFEGIDKGLQLNIDDWDEKTETLEQYRNKLYKDRKTKNNK